MSLPFELNWGIETVIKELRPGANFTLIGSNIVEWRDPQERSAPTWAEINAELEKLHAKHKSGN